MKWFVKNGDGRVRGPVDTEELCRWARDGTLTGTERISTDKDVWIEVVELPDLQEDVGWMSSLASPAAVDPEERRLEQAAEAREVAESVEFEYQPEKWSIEKEVVRWKALYERDHERWKTAAARLQEQLLQLERDGASHLQELEELRLDHRKLKQICEDLKDAADTEPDERSRKLQLLTQQNIALRNSCDALAESHAVLARQLAEKVGEQETLQILREEAEGSAEERIRGLVEQLVKERELGADLRRHLSEVEKKYELVARACKEMNQHLVEHSG